MIDEEQAAYARGFADASRMAGNHFEDWRKRNHHEVLCLVLKKVGCSFDPDDELRRSDNAFFVRVARELTDLAYPPPKPAYDPMTAPRHPDTDTDTERGWVQPKQEQP